jgi:acetolactate synthase-1/2/3 large subunit
MKVSDYIFNYLNKKGLDTIFTVSGGAAAHLLDAVTRTNFKYICNYHEQACAMAAEGYARIANKPAIVLVTNGPGSSNTITGVLGAYQDSIPMIVISGQVPINQSLGNLKDVNLRQLGVQECDIISIVTPITKYAKQITKASDIKLALHQAYNLAISGRKGPVWLDIPLDIQSAEIDDDIFEEEIEEFYNESNICNLNKIITLLSEAKNPVIITGNGIHLSRSEKIFTKLKDKLQIPIVSTWTSKDLMSQTDPLNRIYLDL